MRIERGFDDAERDQIAAMFWDAFAGKLGRILRPEDKALAFLSGALRPEYGLVARAQSGALLGVAGFKTRHGGLVGGTYRDLMGQYGRLGALWRGVLLDLTDRPLKEGQFLMDGIFVARSARGQGVGSALIEAIVAEARRRHQKEVRLDVIDTNLRARALYERHGFVPVDRVSTGPFVRIFGFREATTMCRELG